MRLDVFERLVSHAAVFLLLVAPIQSVAMVLLFSEGRALRAVFGVVYFGIGVALKIGLRRFKTNLRSGLRLVEWCFYLGSAGMLAGLVHMLSGNLVFFASVPGILFVLGNVAFMVVGFLVVKKAIDGIKAQNLGAQPE